MRTIDSMDNFTKLSAGHGHVEVIYADANGNKWSNVTDDVILIDATFGEENPKKEDIKRLKKIAKAGRKLK